MKKGITPVVAMILLLLITIAVIGFAAGFFQRLIGGSGAEIVAAGEKITEDSLKTLKIDNLRDTNGGTAGGDTEITLRSASGKAILGSEIIVFVNGQRQDCDATFVADGVPTSGYATCTIAGVDCNGLDVKITTPCCEYTQRC